MRLKYLSGLLTLTLLLAGISACKDEPDLVRPDVSGIQVDTRIRRFERDLFAMDTSRMEAERARLDTLYGEFARIFFHRILGIDQPQIAPEGPDAYLKGFVVHPETRKLHDTIQLAYPDLSREKEIFDQAFRYLLHYFPERPHPTITTFLSEYSIANFIYGEDELAIGLDLYLGEDYPYSRIDPTNPLFSLYLTRTYNRDHLVPRTIKPLVEDLVGPPAGERLVDHIIRNGKVLYILDLILPGVQDSSILAYTPQQLQWVSENERDIWAFFSSENLLYSTDWKKYRKYVEFSPHSPGMPEEAPGRTGDWIGMRIARAWMDRHPDAGLAELVAQRDAQTFLEESRYKPRR